MPEHTYWVLIAWVGARRFFIKSAKEALARHNLVYAAHCRAQAKGYSRQISHLLSTGEINTLLDQSVPISYPPRSQKP